MRKRDVELEIGTGQRQTCDRYKLARHKVAAEGESSVELFRVFPNKPAKIVYYDDWGL